MPAASCLKSSFVAVSLLVQYLTYAQELVEPEDHALRSEWSHHLGMIISLLDLGVILV